MADAGPRKAPPRYQAIADLLRKQIGEGRYRVGGRLPTEQRLCEMFDASRLTLREALRRLSEEGLIVRKPRLGSIIVASRAPTVLVQTVTSIDALLNYPTATVRKTMETRYIEADRALASELGCPVGTPWFLIGGLRFPKGQSVPICWTNIYVTPKYASVVKHKMHDTVPVADLIEELFGQITSRTQIEIEATDIPAGLARRLGVPAGSAALEVIRRYTGPDGDMFQASISIHPAKRYTYSFELRRERRGVAIAPKRRLPGRSVP